MAELKLDELTQDGYHNPTGHIQLFLPQGRICWLGYRTYAVYGIRAETLQIVKTSKTFKQQANHKMIDLQREIPSTSLETLARDRPPWSHSENALVQHPPSCRF